MNRHVRRAGILFLVVLGGCRSPSGQLPVTPPPDAYGDSISTLQQEILDLRQQVQRLNYRQEQALTRMDHLSERLLRRSQEIESLGERIGELAAHRNEMQSELERQRRIATALAAGEYVRNPRRGTVAHYLAEVPFEVVLAMRGSWDESTFIKVCLARIAHASHSLDAIEALFDFGFDEVSEAAHGTLWRIALPVPDRMRPTLEFCEYIEGPIAGNVIRLARAQDGGLRYIVPTAERLHVFASDSFHARPAPMRAFILNRGRVVGSRSSGRPSVRPWNSRGTVPVPDGMVLPILHIGLENYKNWIQNAFRTPAWAAPYIPEEFAATFRPAAENRAGEEPVRVLWHPEMDTETPARDEEEGP